MIRFFANSDDINNRTVLLGKEDSDHIRSLRLRPDEVFVVCDGNGNDYYCTLAPRGSDIDENTGQSIAQVLKTEKSSAEPSIKCNMFIAYAKGDRLDYAVQKCVELGAHSIVLYDCERCIARPSNVNAKKERYQRIALETAKQSGRGIVPVVSTASVFNHAAGMASDDSDLAILCYEDESNLHLMTVLEHYFPLASLYSKPMNRVKSIAVITGPEGGFDPVEVEYAQSLDISVVTLGSRILRCETAPVTALSAIMYHTGNL